MLVKCAELEMPAGYDAMIARRQGHEPVAYITGRQAFWDLDLLITTDVLIPRSDSETLIDASVSAFADRAAPATILDLGTGSGALLLAALSAFPTATGIGIDASKAALAVAKQNAEICGFNDRTNLVLIDWRVDGWLAALPAPFDLILANPPYIADGTSLDEMVAQHEPHNALFAGSDGLDDYRILLPAMANLLSVGGTAIFEIGFDQADSVSNLARNAGLEPSLRLDLSGNPRALVLKRAA